MLWGLELLTLDKETFVNLVPIINGKSELAEWFALNGESRLLDGVLEELKVAVASNEVDSARSEDHKELAWDVCLVECLEELLGLATDSLV